MNPFTSLLANNNSVTTSLLHTLPDEGNYIEYDSAQIFTDANYNVIVLSSFGSSSGQDERALLFVSDGKAWVNSESVSPRYSIWHGMVNNGIFQAYVLDIPQIKERSHVQKVFIYGLTKDTRLNSKPAHIIEMDEKKKVFKQEESRIITKVLPLQGDPNKFFLAGYYVEHSSNPLDFIRRVTSGGHWGFVTKPFLARVDQDRITEYYTTSNRLEINENSGEIGTFLAKGAKIHQVGIKHREYSDDSPVVQYSHFDVFKSHWTEPVELFKGCNRSEEVSDTFSTPCLAYYNGDIYCVWSWTVIDTATNERTARPKESGIYFCNRTDGRWNNATKIADSGFLPRVIVNKTGTVFVFWIEENTGVVYKRWLDNKWSKIYLAAKASTIRGKELGVPGSASPPFDVVVDRSNNFHIVYVLAEHPEKLVYTTLTSTENRDM